MRTKKPVIIAVVIGVMLISGMAVMRASPSKQEIDERLQSFPAHDLPLKAPAVIYWDEHLIPFIDAETDEDCAFLLGTVHAHLRPAQMTLLRRVVEGRLAESAGPLAASVDHALRIADLAAAADSIEIALSDDAKRWMENFVRGINYYQQNMTELHVEIKLAAITPEPWTVRDVIKVGRLASADVNWFNWFQWLTFREKPYWQEIWRRFLQLGEHSTPSFVADHGAISAAIKSGSNALAVSAARSADGHAIMASDPHLGLQLPNTWLIAGYRCPSFHVVGLMFPGVPMVLVGRNPQIAWSGTNMRSASSDLYELPADRLEDLKTRTEKIRVRAWRDREVTVRTSPVGPVLSDAPFFKDSHKVLAVRWVGHQATDEFSAFYRLNQARDWRDFRSAFASYGVSGQNFLYADADGHIGMIAAVKIPNRPQALPDDFLLDPDNPLHRWNGLIGSLDLPSAYDPAEGFIVSANNRPFPHNPAMGYFFSANDRVERLTELLRQNDRVDLAYIKQMQRDVFVPSAFRLNKLLLQKIDALAPALPKERNAEELLRRLRGWDGHYRADSEGAVAFQLLSFHLIRTYYGRRYDQDFAVSLLSSEQVNFFLEQDLIEEEDQNLKALLEQTIEEAAKDLKFADWGEMHRLRLNHIFGGIPVIGGRYRFEERPVAGSYNTAMKTAHQITNKKHDTFYGANARFIAMMRDLDENYFVLLGGQDGWLGSNHFLDQAALWHKGEYLQIPLRIENIRKRFPHQMVLQNRSGGR